MIARNRSEHLQTELQPEVETMGAGGDFVDLFFSYVSAISPGFADDVENENVNLEEVKHAIRLEFGGRENYVRSFSAVDKKEVANKKSKEVLRLFDGKNANEIAQKLGISRSTVYRYLKKAAFSLTISDDMRQKSG